MITTDFVPGSPCWIDLGAPDVGAAAAFYGAVFGWQFEPMHAGEEAEGEAGGVFKLDGKMIAGLGPLSEKGARSAWMIYFNTADVDATTRAVESGGGTVRVAPKGVGDVGRMAQFTDPQGGQFAAFQPGGMTGMEAADEPGTLTWVELYTTDSAAAQAFYRSVFDWQTQDMQLPGGPDTYTLLTPSGLGEERMQGGLMQLTAEHLALTGGRAYWHPVFGSTDTDATLAKVTENGGSVQMGPEDAEGVGRLAVAVDPFGADFVVLTPAPPQS
ncbi:VOC family protein [Streptomyces pathocidini]|uniref:VOC family protein n=1 Tax=Streptomyces pathocidini TaxID=1650571 RepID=A0ABW7UX71_9ACTN|nr:VOC family protein [Streptomyces pathocidini]